MVAIDVIDEVITQDELMDEYSISESGEWTESANDSYNEQYAN